MVVLLLSFFVVLFVVVALWFYQRRPKGFPRGPWGIPILGAVPFLGKDPYKTLSDMTKKYGPVMGLYFGSTRVVVLSRVDLIKECYKQVEFSSRPKTPFFLRGRKERRGIVANAGEDWIEQRRFVFHHLKNMGFGKRDCEGIIMDEVYSVLDRIRHLCKEPVDIASVFSIAVSNVLLRMVFGRHNEQGDNSFLEWIEKCQQYLGDPKTMMYYNYMPWILKWLPSSERTKYNNAVDHLRQFSMDEIERHIATYNEHEIRDLIDAYIRQVLSTTDPSSSFYKDKGWDSLCAVLEDLLLGVLDTTPVSFTWLFVYLCQYPGVQEKCRKEIEKQVGRDRLPGYSDRNNLPYCEATVYEGLRFSTVTPLAGLRIVQKTTVFKDYVFPKDTIVMSNLWHSNFDENFWENPHEFRPERFITAEGNFKPNSNLMSFSTGKRACPGEPLARLEMFLITAALIQKFSFTLPPEEEPPKAASGINIIRHVEPFRIIVTPLFDTN